MNELIATIDHTARGLRALSLDRADYLADRHPRHADHEEALRRFDATAEQFVSDGLTRIEKLRSDAERNWWAHRKKNWSSTEVDAAARRFWRLREAGLTLDEILDPARRLMPDREHVEAVRRELRTDLTVTMPKAGADEIERRVQDVELVLLRHEISMMDGVEGAAAQQLIDARRAQPAVDALRKLATNASVNGGSVDTTDELALGFAIVEAER